LRAVASSATVQLLTVEPDLGRFLTPEERDAAAGLPVPAWDLSQGMLDVETLLVDARAFGAIVLEGMLLHYLQVGEQAALRLIGPGDVLSRSGILPSMVVDSRNSVAAPTRVAMLDNDVLLAARRWPLLIAGLHLRMAEQSERLATQLAICQMPRVDQRVLALMWLLAESWGRVTSVGTRVSLALTHDAIGCLIGSRRPTVTLALSALVERGAIARQEDGWLLLERPPIPDREPRLATDPVVISSSATTSWDETAEDFGEMGKRGQEQLRATVRRLQEEQTYNVERFRERLTAVTQVRERAIRSRRRIERERLSLRRAPSA
jgi:CRP/FNR family transcriptional regulator, cyclic AMP receptor protein